MSKTAVVFTCAHAEPHVSNERFDWLGQFLYDIKPDYVIDLGDGADMRSLNTYDTKKPEAIVAQSYEEDIDCYNEAQDRLRHLFKKNKKRRPAFFGFEGNHEHRIKTALTVDPRLGGERYGISFGHLNTDHWFDEYHEYTNGAPSIHCYQGIDYAHYISSGNYGSAMSGIHHAYGLLNKRFRSVTVGHSHKRDMYFKDDANTKGAIGLVAGCFKGAAEDWAGQANGEWWSGIILKKNISDGVYEPSFISLETLRREYS